MNRRNFLKNIGITVAVAPIAATTIQEAVKVHEELHEKPKFSSDELLNAKMNIDSNYPEFFMSWDDPDGIYIRKSTKTIFAEKK